MRTLIVLLLLSASAHAETWSVLTNFSNTVSPTSQDRSLRGLAISPDGSTVYGGFIQGTSSSSVFSDDSTSGIVGITSLIGNSNAGGKIAGNFQPKGVAVDDRGNVYATMSPNANSTTGQFRVYDSSLNVLDTATTVASTTSSQLGGLSAVTFGGTHYLYVAHNKGSMQIERWNVENPAVPTLDTSFGTSGIFNVGPLVGIGGSVPGLNGLEVAADGTIYVTALTSIGVRGDKVYAIDPSLSTFTAALVPEAMDLALFGGKVYVTEYAANLSTIAVLDQATLSSLGTLNTGIPHPNTTDDNGYSGITIGPDGRIFVADQVYQNSANPIFDRILVSSPVPEPSTLVLAGIALMLFVVRKLA